MELPRPTVIRPADSGPPPGPPTAGMDRRQLVDQDELWIGWLRTEAGMAGGWHHHGRRESYVFVLNGRLIIEWGAGGAESVEVGPGELVVNPAGMIHREITSPEEPVEAVVVRIGPGPLNVNVEGPEPV